MVSYASGFFYRVIVASLAPLNLDHKELNSRTAQCFIIFGISEVVAGTLNAKFSDKMDKYKLISFSCMLSLFSFMTGFLAYYYSNYYLCMAALAFLGFSECCFNSGIAVALSNDYGNKLEAFAVYRMLAAIGSTLTQILCIFLHSQLIFISLFIGIGSILYLASVFYFPLPKKVEEAATTPEKHSLFNNSEVTDCSATMPNDG